VKWELPGGNLKKNEIQRFWGYNKKKKKRIRRDIHDSNKEKVPRPFLTRRKKRERALLRRGFGKARGI